MKLFTKGSKLVYDRGSKVWKALTLVLAAGSLLFLLAGCGSGATTAGSTGETYRPEKFRFGVFASDDSAERVKRFAPFVEYLEQELGMEVEQFVGSDYVTVVEAMRAKKVDAMYVGPFAYVLAVQEANAEAISAGVDDKGRTYYLSHIITRSDSGVTSMADLKKKAEELTFSFVDPASTSGHLFPRMVLIKAGIDPDKDFKETIFAGSHPASVLSVQNGKVDAGATYDKNLDNMTQAGQIKPEDTVFWLLPIPFPTRRWRSAATWIRSSKKNCGRPYLMDQRT